jgi:hypothetical protein
MPSVKGGIVGSFNLRPRLSLLPPKGDVRASCRICLRHPQVTASPNPPLVHHINVTLRLPRPRNPCHSTSPGLMGTPTSTNHTAGKALFDSYYQESKSILAYLGHQRHIEVPDTSMSEGNKADNVGDGSRSRIEISRFLACFVVFVITGCRLVCRKPFKLSYKQEPKQRRGGSRRGKFIHNHGFVICS